MKSKTAANALSTWFGCGYSPVAPGTAGSLAAVAIAWGLAEGAGWKPWHFAALAAAITPVSILAASVTARDSGRKDPQFVVVDEVVGQWISLAGAVAFNWKSAALGFALFRLFDIWKPAPVRQLERLPEGWGIMADDVMAGVYSALVLFLLGCFNLY